MRSINTAKKIKILLLSTLLVLSFMHQQCSSTLASTLKLDPSNVKQINQPVSVTGGQKKVLMKVRSISLRDLLKLLSTQAGFNLLLDDSVQGEISVDLNNVSINQALDSVKDYASLVFLQDNKTLIVASKNSSLSKTMNLDVTQMIPVKYINAKLVAKILNDTVLSTASTGGQSSATSDAGGSSAAAPGKKASVEFRTNSVVIVGTNHDIQLAQDLISKIDIPRQGKSFKINNASVYEVAQLLQATVFNDGIAPFDGTVSDGSLQASAISVITETFEEGSGASNEVQSASTQGGGGSQQTFTLRKESIQSKDIKISPQGPLIIPDSRTNTLTIMGTSEQIALAESVIPSLDQKLPQVAIETSLVEVLESGLRDMEIIWGNNSGQWATGFNNRAASSIVSSDAPGIQPQADGTATVIDQNGAINTVTLRNYFGLPYNIIGLPTLNGQGGIGANGAALAFTTAPIQKTTDFIYQINMVISKRKAKLLANPTVVAVHNSEAIISITDEIIRRTTITRDSTGFEQLQTEIGEAGIVLNILPKITGDGYINLKIRPSVSTIANQIVDASGNITTLLNRRDFAVQEARVANGQTLALGGLLQETATKDASRVPGISDLPIIGALFRSSSNAKQRTELLMLVTPKILKDDNPVVSSSFREPSLVETIRRNPVNIELSKPASAPALNKQRSEMPVLKPQVTQNKQSGQNLDSIMNELGIDGSKTDKKYNKDEVNKILNEYIPQGSK